MSSSVSKQVYYYAPPVHHPMPVTYNSTAEKPVTGGLDGGFDSDRCWKRARCILIMLILVMIVINWILALLFLIKAGGGQAQEIGGPISAFQFLSRFIGAGLVLSTLGGVACGTVFIFSALIVTVAQCIRTRFINSNSSASQSRKQYKEEMATADGGKLDIPRFDPIKTAWQTAIIGWSLTVIIGLIAIKVAVLLLVA